MLPHSCASWLCVCVCVCVYVCACACACARARARVCVCVACVPVCVHVLALACQSIKFSVFSHAVQHALISRAPSPLSPQSLPTTTPSCFVQELFRAPIVSQVKEDALPLQEQLRLYAKKAYMLIVATDNDREGEVTLLHTFILQFFVCEYITSLNSASTSTPQLHALVSNFALHSRQLSCRGIQDDTPHTRNATSSCCFACSQSDLRSSTNAVQPTNGSP